MPRHEIDLSGVWRFMPDPIALGESAGYSSCDFDDAAWPEVPVPCCFDSCLPGLEGYRGLGWFRRRVSIPAHWGGRRVVLRFNGINDHARVWLNGAWVGENVDSFLPFEFDVTEAAEPGRVNTLVVATDNRWVKGEVPGENRGWCGFGGFQRGAVLLATSRQYIRSLKIRAEPCPGGGALRAWATVANHGSDEAMLEVALEIRDADGGEVAMLEPREVRVPSGSSADVVIESQVPGAVAWSPNNPCLYHARAALTCNGVLADTISTRFGFRKIATDGTRLLLNGEPLFLTGWNRHEDSPRTNMVPDVAMTRFDLMEMKRAGANFVRLCHYPHDSAELDLCDELGLLVMGEIPLYQWKLLSRDPQYDDAKRVAAYRHLRAMIERDFNHPSVIFWCVSNENREEYPEVAEAVQDLVRQARSLDDSRLCVHVSSYWPDHPHFDADDVLCLNAYPGLVGLATHGAGYPLEEATRWWRENLAHMHRLYPDKPIVVTEFGTCSLKGCTGGAFGEETACRVIEAEHAGMDADYVSGVTVWCWADHAWDPQYIQEAQHGLSVSPYGVLTRDRERKAPYWTVRRLFERRQGFSGGGD